MDGVLFEEWVRELDGKFSSEGRSVALVTGNCSGHPHIENLKSMKLLSFYHQTPHQQHSLWIKA